MKKVLDSVICVEYTQVIVKCVHEYTTQQNIQNAQKHNGVIDTRS